MNIEELKQKHGVIFTLEIPTGENGEVTTIHLRKLDRTTYSAVSKLIQKDELQAAEVLLKNLYVGGDNLDIITQDFDNLRSASNAVAEMLKAKEGVLKKN